MVLLFAGSNHYPVGGFGDYKGLYLNIEQAKYFIETDLRKKLGGGGWYDIVDYKKMELIEKGKIK